MKRIGAPKSWMIAKKSKGIHVNNNKLIYLDYQTIIRTTQT